MLASECMTATPPEAVMERCRRVPGSVAARPRGFTLLELVIVLAIVALGAFVVAPNFSGMNARTFNAQVREANALLNYSRRTAVVTGQPAAAVFVTDGGNGDEASAGEAATQLRRGTDEVWSRPGIEVRSEERRVGKEGRTGR